MDIASGAVPRYFDMIFSELAKEDSVMGHAFGNHVHWGFWPEPETADISLSGFLAAADRLSDQHFALAGLADGQKILDTGCGFGGSLGLLNSRYQNMELHGLNIDPRQVERARAQVLSRDGSGNRIEFKVGDACQLDAYPDGYFDVVLAVECIFNFPSRLGYFKEAHRVLKPGGRLVFSDFTAYAPTFFLFALVTLPYMGLIKKHFSVQSEPVTEAGYKRLVAEQGFSLLEIRDITTGTLPTYRFLSTALSSESQDDKELAKIIRFQHWVSRVGFHRYQLFALQK